jgi:hypothetical protein
MMNWAARRKALLEIGGFRAASAPALPLKTQFADPELSSKFSAELVQTAMLHHLGYKLAIVPQAEITLQVEPKDCTINYAQQAISQAVMARYIAERNLFIPMSYVPIPALLRQPRLWLLYRKARMKVLLLQLKDLRHRAFRS